MTSLYQSNQDFSARLAAMSATSVFLHNLLPRTLAHDSQATFERHLHDAMGWKASTIRDDEF